MQPHAVNTEIHQAFDEWRSVLGSERVLSAEQATTRYGVNALGVRRNIAGALMPVDADEVVALVRIAARHAIPLYPISTGHNWGYGSATPPRDDCVIVDLSTMDKILAMDPELGVVTLQPGVTQQALRSYLDQHHLPYLVPVHGGGPTCSIVGNALERGYGITPYADHFSAVMSLEVVLADGTIYRSPHEELGGSLIANTFKWGVGPYLDGIFTQANLGIVTQMTIALAPVPERIEAFFFAIERDEGLEGAVAALRGILRSVGSVTGSINLMNARRVLSMIEPYPHAEVPPGQIIPERLVAEMARKNHVFPWMGVGALYGDRKVVNAAKARIKHCLKPVAKRVVFLSQGMVSTGARLVALLPGRRLSALRRTIGSLQNTLQLLAGAPSRIALPLAYWKTGGPPNGATRLDPARDGCGLIWYAPLVPMHAGTVRRYVELVNSICPQYGIEPLITLTSLSDRCFDSTVPILFDRNDAEQVTRAHACYERLFSEGKKAGFLPYRAGIHSMQYLYDPDMPYWQLAARIKTAVDPKNIFAPGRYIP